MITDLFKSNIGKIIISIIWALGLSTIFRYSCDGKNCKMIIYRGGNAREIESNVYNYGTKDCYRYKALISSC